MYASKKYSTVNCAYNMPKDLYNHWPWSYGGLNAKEQWIKKLLEVLPYLCNTHSGVVSKLKLWIKKCIRKYFFLLTLTRK